MLPGIIIGAVILFVLILLWSIYNKLIKARNIVEEGLSGIDVQLTKRFELIPNLIECVKGYNDHEAQTLQNIVEMRAATGKGIEGRTSNDSSITLALKQFRVQVENYPDLKADSQFLILMKEISTIENELSMARRYYNGTVRDFNTKLQVFPNVLFAPMFGMKQAEFYELSSEAERMAPTVDLDETK